MLACAPAVPGCACVFHALLTPSPTLSTINHSLKPIKKKNKQLKFIMSTMGSLAALPLVSERVCKTRFATDHVRARAHAALKKDLAPH
jgi:hypothetical protein